MANIDYLNPFTTYPGAGWSEATGPINEPSGTSSAFQQDDFGNDTTHENGKSARINIYGTAVDEYLITPKYDLSGGTYYLNADLALTLFANSNASALDPDDYLALLVTQDDGATWTELARWDENSSLTPEGAPMDEIMLTGYNSETYFSFYAFSDTSGVDNDLFIDNFQITAASLTVQTAPTADAPVPPARQAGDVISVFSDSYTNINVTNFNPGWGQTGAVDAAYDPTGEGTNTVLEYSNFNYQGTEFETTDASVMEFVHIDIWTSDATDVKFSPINNGTGVAEILVNVPLVAGAWSSVDIPIADFTGMTWDSLFQMKFDGGAGVNPSTIYIDNVYFWKNPTTAPTTNAPMPPEREAGDVISIYSDAYATNQPTVYNPTFDKIAKSSGSDCACAGWINKDIADQGESSTTNGSDVVKLDDFESDGIYQEIAVQANSNYTLDLDFKYGVDPSTTEYIEVLILKGSSYVSGYTPAYAAPDTAAQEGFGYQEVSEVDDTNNHVSSYLITHPGDENLNAMTQLSFNTGSETSIAIFIRAVGPYDAANHGDSGKDKGWMNGDAEVRLDNLSLVNQGVHSNANITNFNPDWGQTGEVDAAYDPTGEGTNTVLEYSNFNYQGTEFDAIDASAMEFVHIDIWTADATDVKFTPINNGTGVAEILVNVPLVTGGWSSVDIPISDFTGMTWDSLFQMKFDGGAGVNPSTVYIDNVYFYKEPVVAVSEPTEAAPTPPARETGDVVSLFSDAYTDVTLTELPTEWSDLTTFEATTVAGDNVWKLSGLEFLGMVTNYDTGIDVSTMEKLHIDYWVPTGVENELIVKIVNTIDGGEDIESLGTTVSGSWQSIDLDMSGFDGGNLANTEKITQILFDAVERATTVYVDNFYFYKEPVVISEPTEAAPTPPARETGDVVSLFSDAYTDVTLTELPTEWSDLTTFEATTVAGDNVWKLSGLEFLGMVTNYDTGIDVSTMEKLHIDYWVPTGVENELIVKIVNTIDGGEDIESLGTTVSGSWQSIDLDMSGFDGGNLANKEKITQILFDAVERATTVYVDNFYFYKEPSTTSDIIFITELADPNDNDAARYVEIYNGGTAAVDLTGWTLRRYTNGNSEPQTTGEDLSPIGSLAPGGIAIIAANGTAFEAAFGMAADISAGSGGPADSNGDDQIYITDASDTIVDFFGVPGEDGTGTDHEFEDGRAERKASVTQGTATWDVDEWNIDSDAGTGDGALDVDEGFDPGVWIGADTAGLDNESLVTFNMYPNPANDVLNISSQSTINKVEIFNVLGQKVITIQVDDLSAEINVSNLNAGIYLIKYEINNSTSTKKFVKN